MLTLYFILLCMISMQVSSKLTGFRDWSFTGWWGGGYKTGEGDQVLPLQKGGAEKGFSHAEGVGVTIGSFNAGA